jgi:tRNA/rRNA methyltransferase
MANMGVGDLVLVGSGRLNRFHAGAMAVHARGVLERMRLVPTLGEAVSECGLVVGTTCRGGTYRDGALAPRRLAGEIVRVAAENRVALVFGPEDHGLTNDDLRLCHRLVTIAADPAYPSLNVAQAVLLCCYELFLAARGEGAHGDEDRAARPLASSAAVELMYEKLKEAFLGIGFLHANNPEHIMFAFRRIFGRAGLEERDVRILLGLARQIRWYAESGRKARAERRRAARSGRARAVGSLGDG